MTAPTSRAAETQVLCDPWLLAHVGSFQGGLPLALFEFWAQHDPQTARSSKPFQERVRSDMPFYPGGFIDNFQKLVVAKGSVGLMALLEKSRFPLCRHGRLSWLRPQLYMCARAAIECNRVDMVEWAIQSKAATLHPLYQIQEWWTDAVTFHRPNDLAVLDLLHAKRPIEDARLEYTSLSYSFRETTAKHADVALLQWLQVNKPTIMAKFTSGSYWPSSVMTEAVKRGDLAVVRYVHENLSSDALWFGVCELAFKHEHLDVLEYLLEQRPDILDSDWRCEAFQRQLVEDESPAVQALVVKFAAAFRKGFLQQIEQSWGDLDLIQRWHETGLLAKIAPISIDSLAGSSCFETIQFLHERGLATATTDAMDIAVINGAWDIVMYLHEHRSEGCTAAAMDGAVRRGNFDYVQFFHDKYKLGCSATALVSVVEDPLATIDLIRFVLEKNGDVDYTTELMDNAAANGRLNLVELLHRERHEGCTTAAVDRAATQGHIDVITFLLENRPEGFTKEAIERALRYGHLEIVRRLYNHSPDLFGADVLHDVLLRGAFDIFMMLQDKYPVEASAVAESAIYDAGKEKELATIHFIINVLGRKDVAHRAVDGAAWCCNVTWLRAVLAVVSPESVRLSAVHNAIDAHLKKSWGQDEWDYIPFVVRACRDPEARNTAIKKLNRAKQDVDASLLKALDKDEEEEESVPLPALHPLLLDSHTRAWAVGIIFRDDNYDFDRYLNGWTTLTWPVRAIYHRDLPLLEAIHALPTATAQAYEESYPNEKEFTFVDARNAAVREGDLAILQWLLNTVDLPVEPTLLGEAVYYHRYEFAEWLVDHVPKACASLDWRDKGDEPAARDFGLRDGLLDWLEAHNSVRNALDFKGVVDFAARKNDVASLRRLHGWFPDLFQPRPTLVELADDEECRDTINFLLEIGWSPEVFQGGGEDSTGRED